MINSLSHICLKSLWYQYKKYQVDDIIELFSFIKKRTPLLNFMYLLQELENFYLNLERKMKFYDLVVSNYLYTSSKKVARNIISRIVRQESYFLPHRCYYYLNYPTFPMHEIDITLST